MILSCGKSMITDVFGTLSPEIVTASFATAFVSGLSAANLGGRMGWGAISDVMTSRRTMMLFGLLGGPACCTSLFVCSSSFLQIIIISQVRFLTLHILPFPRRVRPYVV